MHESAHHLGRLFFETYWRKSFKTVVDIGSYDVNGSLRDFAPAGVEYIGVDIEAGPGVDIVKGIDDPTPLPDASVDMVVCTSVLEHDDFFWRTFLDMARLLKPGGLMYINAPSNGWFHLHPMDSWRFYPDSGKALTRWARENDLDLILVESFVADRLENVWNDFVGIFAMGQIKAPKRFLSDQQACTNIRRMDKPDRLALRHESQDMLLIDHFAKDAQALRAENVALKARIDELLAGVTATPALRGKAASRASKIARPTKG